MRNATCTTVAPTGTISIIAGCAGGIEPLYSLAFYRNVLKGHDEGTAPMVEVNPVFENAARRRGILSEGLMERLATDGTLASATNVPDDMRRVFVSAHDISPECHMRMQAAFQKHCDASISKTINFPKTAEVGDVDKIYRMAYEWQCKGVTVYRDGCREAQPMALKADKQPDTPPENRPLEPALLPEITSGMRIRQMTPFGNMHINITIDPKTEREMEVFAQLGKGGDLANSDLEAICRMVSLWLRAGGRLVQVVRQLHGIGSSLQVSTREGKIMSLGDGLARAMQRYLRAKEQYGLRALLLGEHGLNASTRAGETETTSRAGGTYGNGNGNGHGHGAGGTSDGDGYGHGAGAASDGNGGVLATSRLDVRGMQWQQAQFKVLCPECQAPLRFSEGCETCDACGYAKC